MMSFINVINGYIFCVITAFLILIFAIIIFSFYHRVSTLFADTLVTVLGFYQQLMFKINYLLLQLSLHIVFRPWSTIIFYLFILSLFNVYLLTQSADCVPPPDAVPIQSEPYVHPESKDVCIDIQSKSEQVYLTQKTHSTAGSKDFRYSILQRPHTTGNEWSSDQSPSSPDSIRLFPNSDFTIAGQPRSSTLSTPEKMRDILTVVSPSIEAFDHYRYASVTSIADSIPIHLKTLFNGFENHFPNTSSSLPTTPSITTKESFLKHVRYIQENAPSDIYVKSMDDFINVRGPLFDCMDEASKLLSSGCSDDEKIKVLHIRASLVTTNLLNLKGAANLPESSHDLFYAVYKKHFDKEYLKLFGSLPL